MLRKTIPICFLLVAVLSTTTIADDLTKEIQKDLIALGYDPGNIQGELSTETIVAISQFQAENDLEVTGEASPQLAGIIKARLDERNNPVAATQPMDPAALQAAQQACLREKVEAAQASQKKKRGFGSLMRAVTNTAVRFGGSNDLARQVQETSYEIYRVDATAEDWERAAKDLGLTQNDLEACRNPVGSGATLNVSNSGDATQPQPAGAAVSGAGAMQQLTPEQRQALEQSGMGGMFEQMMGGVSATSPAFASQPDKNIDLPESYDFSYRVSMRITNSRGTAEPVFYVQPDAPYYARTQSKNGVTEFLVYDNQRNLAVLFAEKDGKKRRVHNRLGLETKAALLGLYRDTPSGEPLRSIGSKTILGYPSQGYEISTLAGTTQLWITDQAPASLFSTMFEGRTDATGDSPLKKHSMIMEITFTSANTPEDNYHMECTQLQPENLILNKNDYQKT